eukprot:11199537-Heterocapsa_arctica.AAC.1
MQEDAKFTRIASGLGGLRPSYDAVYVLLGAPTVYQSCDYVPFVCVYAPWLKQRQARDGMSQPHSTPVE